VGQTGRTGIVLGDCGPTTVLRAEIAGGVARATRGEPLVGTRIDLGFMNNSAPTSPKDTLMVKIRIPLRFSALAIAALTGLATAQARADISYDFNNGNDNGLTHYDPLAPFGSGSTFTFPVLGPGNDGYRLTSGPSADYNTLGASRVGAYAANETFTTFRESVDLVGWNASLQQGIGLFARGSNIGLGTSDGYYLHYNTNPADSQSGLQSDLDIDRIDNESVGVNAFTTLSPLDPTVGYRLVFTGMGATLTGQIFALSDLNDPLASVTLTDATYQSGYAGLLTSGLAGGANDGEDATFDNFSAQSVPEPSSLVLASLALAGLVLARTMRHHRVKA
jgi:hypothetical protein